MHNEQKFLKFQFEIMTLMSSANHIGSDVVFILRRRLCIYIYIMNNTGPRIDRLVVVHNLTATFCLMFVK